MSLWDWLSSEDGAKAIAGVAGAAVSAALEWTGVLQAIRKIFIGGISAYYLAPLSVPMFEWALGSIHVDPANSASLSGFIMGVVGITVIEIMVKAFKLRRDEIGAGK